MPKPPNKPRRRKSFAGQWDKTTKVVNVKQKYYVNGIDRYTDVQKATFTRWVNIQLRSIHRYDLLNSNNDNNDHGQSLAGELPEIKAIDKDFRDGTRLIKLLEVIYEGDPELPKCERGNTRHHHIANASNVLDFLRNRLDESGQAALHAIGPVDIVDGNVKLTLGLIWLIISRFHQMVSVFEEIMTEEELAVAKAQSRLLNGGIDNGDNKKIPKNHGSSLWFNLDIESIESHIDKMESIANNNKDDVNTSVSDNNDNFKDETKKVNDSRKEDDTILEEFEGNEQSEQINKEDFLLKQQQEKESEKKSNNDCNDDDNISNSNNNDLEEKPINVNNSVRYSKMFLNPRQNLNIMENYNKRMSLPAATHKEFQLPPKRFRTLRLSDPSMSISSSSGLLFWLNMQLIDYASVLPSSSYPIEDFTGLNDGMLLSALIHHNDMGWAEDFDLSIKDPPDNKDESTTTTTELVKIEPETKTKERLQKCFKIIEEKLNVKPPKALISVLIVEEESDDDNDPLNKEQIKSKTGIAWNMYISEIFIAMTANKKMKKDQSKLSVATQQKQQQQQQQQREEVDANVDSISREPSESPTAEVISPQSTLFDEPLEEGYSPYSTTKDAPMACSPLLPLPLWSPKKSLIDAVWDWTMKWIVGDSVGENGSNSDNDDDYDDHYNYDNHDNYGEGYVNGNGGDTKYDKHGTKSNWNIQNINEWNRNYKGLNNNDCDNKSNVDDNNDDDGDSSSKSLSNVH